MRWQHVQANWSAFFEAIQSRWPDVDFDDLEDVDGDYRNFIDYIASVEALDEDEAEEEIREWLRGELPADVIMDTAHDNRSILMSRKYVSEDGDESDDDQLFGDDDEDEEDEDDIPDPH